MSLAEWSLLDSLQQSDNNVQGWVYTKVATGDERDFTFFSNVSQRSSNIVLRITDGGTVENAGMLERASTSTPDNQAHTPSGGSDDYLWIAVNWTSSRDLTIDAYPTSYINNTFEESGSGGAASAHANIALATRELTASTETPSEWDNSGSAISLVDTLSVAPAVATQPSVATIASSSEDDAGGLNVVVMPLGITAGDILMLFIAVHGIEPISAYADLPGVSLKPGPWAAHRGAVAPEWQHLWDGLQVIMPFWDESGSAIFDHAEARPTIFSAPFLETQPSGVGVTFDESDDYFDYAQADAEGAWNVGPNEDFAIFVALRTGTVSGNFWQYVLSSGSYSGVATFNMYFGEDGSGEADAWSIVTSNAEAHSTAVVGGTNADTDYTFIGMRDVSGQGLQTWVNGQFLTNDVSDPGDQIEINGEGLEVGRRADADGDRYFGGTVYVVYKWNRALSPGEITQLEADPYGPIRSDYRVPILTPGNVTQPLLVGAKRPRPGRW